MPPASVGLPSDPNPMDRPNPLSRPYLVKLGRCGRSVSTAPKPPVSGYNPFCSESESDPVQQRVQSLRPFDSDATFSGPGTSESSSQDPPVTSVFGFSSSTNADKGTNSSSSTKGSGETGSGPFVFGNSKKKSSESNLKDGKENKPVYVSGAPENMLASSNLPEKLQTWHPFKSCTESKENSSKDGASVSGDELKGKVRSEEEFLAENVTVREGGGSDPSSTFTFVGGNSVPDGKDVTENADSLREKLEKTVHISSSAVPEDKDESVIGKFTSRPTFTAFNMEDVEEGEIIDIEYVAMKKLETGARKKAGLGGKKKPARPGNPTMARPHAPSMEDVEEGEIIDMDYVAMANNVSGSSFRFTSSTTTQGPLRPVHRRHFRRKNRVTRSLVESTEDQVVNSSVQPTSQLANESTPHVRTRVDCGRQEARNRTETKEATSPSGGALESCEKWRMRGNQAYADGCLQKAEEYYTQGINSVTSEECSAFCARELMLCFSNRAATRMSLGRMREAFVDCLIALETDPGFFRACVRAANCLLALGEVEEATKYYNRCIQSDGVDSKILTEAREGLGKAEKFTQYVEQAMQLIQKGTSAEVERVLELISDAMLIGSNSDNLTEMKAKTLLLLSKYEEVIELCEHNSDLAEKNSNMGRSSGRDPRLWRWVLVARSNFYLGKLDEALQVLKKYEEVKPTDERFQEIFPSPDVINELLRLKASANEAFQAGKYAEAVESYTVALTYNSSSRPFSAICFGNRAAAYQAQGQIMDAIADCCMAIALDPNYVKAISRRATLYEKIRDYGQAASDLRRLILLLEKQLPETQTACHGKSSKSNTELHRASVRLSSVEEEARKRTPLKMYLILGIENTSSAADIKKAYRKAALRHHPDKAGQVLLRCESDDKIVHEIQRYAGHIFKIIGEAYNVLSDDIKRLKYDTEEVYHCNSHYSSRHSWRAHRRWSDEYYWWGVW